MRVTFKRWSFTILSRAVTAASRRRVPAGVFSRHSPIPWDIIRPLINNNPEPMFMLGLGLASSHATAMFCPAEAWPTVYAGIPDYMKESQPHTAKLETPEVISQQITRLKKNFAFLRDQIAAYKP